MSNTQENVVKPKDGENKKFDFNKFNKIPIFKVLDYFGLKYRISNESKGEFKLFWDNEWKNAYGWNFKKNVISDFSQDRPKGHPYMFIKEYIEYTKDERKPFDIAKELLNWISENEVCSISWEQVSFDWNNNDMDSTEKTHSSINWMYADVSGKKEKYKVPQNVIQKLEERGIKEQTIQWEEIYFWEFDWNNKYHKGKLAIFAKNGNNEVCGCKLRDLFATDPKYKSIQVPNSRSGLFYNSISIGYDKVFLCEGEMDYLILKQCWFVNVLWNMGWVMCFKKDWIELFKNKDGSMKETFVMYDFDSAGKKWTEKVLRIMEKEFWKDKVNMKVMKLWKEGQDINDIYLELKEKGMSDTEIGMKIYKSFKK